MFNDVLHNSLWYKKKLTCMFYKLWCLWLKKTLQIMKALVFLLEIHIIDFDEVALLVKELYWLHSFITLLFFGISTFFSSCATLDIPLMAPGYLPSYLNGGHSILWHLEMLLTPFLSAIADKYKTCQTSDIWRPEGGRMYVIEYTTLALCIGLIISTNKKRQENRFLIFAQIKMTGYM